MDTRVTSNSALKLFHINKIIIFILKLIFFSKTCNEFVSILFQRVLIFSHTLWHFTCIVGGLTFSMGQNIVFVPSFVINCKSSKSNKNFFCQICRFRKSRKVVLLSNTRCDKHKLEFLKNRFISEIHSLVKVIDLVGRDTFPSLLTIKNKKRKRDFILLVVTVVCITQGVYSS